MKILALLLCVVGAAMAVVSGFMAMFSPMVMDAPGSEKSIFNWMFLCLLLASPLAFVVTDIFAWVQFGKGNYGASVRWVVFGFIPLVLAFVSLFLVGK
jgi:hypothetical protein